MVLDVDRWMCFDACPIYACLPFAAQRIQALTPHAKLIFMVRTCSAVCCVGMLDKMSMNKELFSSKHKAYASVVLHVKLVTNPSW